MKKNIYEAKTKADAINKALEDLKTSENINFEETKNNALKNLSKDKLSLLAFFYLGIDSEKRETEEPSENKQENMLLDIFDDIFKAKGDDKKDGNDWKKGR